ncbi:fungal-specific transcription factor domain-containing protein, partial [Truncatella angustata]
RHMDRLSSMGIHRRLIEHWVLHLSDALSPIPGSINPLKRIFVPIAYEGAMSPASTSTGSVALFYLVCSASAFHISAHMEDDMEKSEFMKLALSHQNEGLRHLQHSLLVDDPSQTEPVLASLLMCLTYEPATVERNFWLVHLQGVSRWLQITKIHDWAHGESAAILYQMLVGTAVFLRSQLLSEKISQDENFHFDITALSGPYHLLHIFGLPKRSLEMINKMISMVVSFRHQSPNDGRGVPLLSPDLDRVEMELYLSMPPDVHTPRATPEQNTMIHHYSQIFYYGSIIYCKRCLRGLPLKNVQSLVKEAFHHIEALAKFTGHPFSPVLWPIAIVFFETQDAHLRTRAIAWLDFIMEHSTISLWQKAKPLIISLWEQRKVIGQEEMQWDIFLSDPSTPSIMLV